MSESIVKTVTIKFSTLRNKASAWHLLEKYAVYSITTFECSILKVNISEVAHLSSNTGLLFTAFTASHWQTFLPVKGRQHECKLP